MVFRKSLQCRWLIKVYLIAGMRVDNSLAVKLSME